MPCKIGLGIRHKIGVEGTSTLGVLDQRSHGVGLGEFRLPLSNVSDDLAQDRIDESGLLPAAGALDGIDRFIDDGVRGGVRTVNKLVDTNADYRQQILGDSLDPPARELCYDGVDGMKVANRAEDKIGRPLFLVRPV